jgi:hypothetical protein
VGEAGAGGERGAPGGLALGLLAGELFLAGPAADEVVGVVEPGDAGVLEAGLVVPSPLSAFLQGGESRASS